MSPTTIHVAEAHLKEERKGELCEVAPLFPELRELLLKKCAPQGIERVRAVIERQSFGELERLVAQTLLHVAQLGADVLHVTPKQRARLDAVIASWECDPATFALTVTLATGARNRFEYGERRNGDQEKGLLELLRDPMLSGSATAGVGLLEVVAIQRPPADGPLLLSGAAEPPRPATLPRIMFSYLSKNRACPLKIFRASPRNRSPGTSVPAA